MIFSNKEPPLWDYINCAIEPFYGQILKFSKRLPEKFSSSLLPLKYTPRWLIGLTYYSLVKGVLQFGQSKVEHGTPG
jgi:hypothetical protein